MTSSIKFIQAYFMKNSFLVVGNETPSTACIVQGYVPTVLFWVVTPCGLMGRYQHFGEAYCLQFQGWRQYVSPKLGVYLEVHMASQPKITSPSSLLSEPQI
jgi:hypothetical protein